MNTQQPNKVNFYDPKLIYTACAVGIILPIYTALVELPTVPYYVELYILGKVAAVSLCLITLIQLFFFNYQYKAQVPLLFSGLALYSIHGQWFFPGYYLAYMQVVVGFGLFFPLNKKIFYSVTGLLTLLMCYSVLASPATYSYDPELAKKFKADTIVGIIVMMIISVACYQFITTVRQMRDMISLKFADVGKNSVSIMHDFKGFLQSPLFLAFRLKNEALTQEGAKIVGLLEEDLNFINNYLKEFNKIYASQAVNMEMISMGEIQNSMQVLLKNHLQGVEISFLNPQHRVFFDKNLLTKIFYNILTNGIEANKNMKHQLRIKVETNEKGNILISDNGKGFDKDKLASLNKGDIVYSAKQNGSGVGLYLVQEILKKYQGRLHFFNNEEGASVEIIFGK